MAKLRVLLKVFLRLAPGILLLEAVVLGVCWLLHRYWTTVQHLSFGDFLFFMGIFMGAMGSIGMLRSPYGVALSPAGVWASKIQVTEEEKHTQMVDELTRKVSFATRLMILGVFTILVSIPITYIK